MSNNGGGGGDPWAWLGLLKWSLSYSDGTKDNSDVSPMSEEDREFLEKVMKEGIIDENERMKFILTESMKAMEYYKEKSLGTESGDQPISDDDLAELLQELRDIVEQIDYARAFSSLKGIPFLVGCIMESKAVPESIRVACTGILATLCQNNPPVQKQLVEIGAIKNLTDVFFDDSTSENLRAKIMQTISAIVRNYDLTETVFCNLDQAPALILHGLDPKVVTCQLRTRTLFFLRALLTSDTSNSGRVRLFESCIDRVVHSYLEESAPAEIREISIALLGQLLRENLGVNCVLKHKNILASLGVQRIGSMRKLTGEDKEYAQVELEYWEDFMVLLARSTPEEEDSQTREKIASAAKS